MLEQKRKIMNYRKSIVAIAALAFMAWGCTGSGSDNDPEQEEPTPVETNNNSIEPGTDERPNWQNPDYNNFEQVMTVEVQLQSKLDQYASENDMMCAIINNEVRGVATPIQVNDKWVFPLVVASNDAGVGVDLSYYCDKLHRIFTMHWTNFDAKVQPTFTGLAADGNSLYKPSFLN